MKRVTAAYKNSSASFALYNLARMHINDAGLDESTQKRIEECSTEASSGQSKCKPGLLGEAPVFAEGYEQCRRG
jgi:hypothetical protein